MYKQKFMKAWSIGFIPIKSEDIVDEEDEKKRSYGRRFKTWELLEFSACSVPNNPHALSNMVSKGIDVEPLEEAGFITIIEEEEKTKYNCECIECGHKIKSEKHCKDLKCPKCGGTMRRVERPGPGEESKIIYDEKLMKEAEEIGKKILKSETFIELTLTEDVVTKPEDTDDSIRLPVKGEEGKHKGHKIRWITVDSKKGIRGIYCIDCKKIITYVFAKDKGWTMAKAKKWMEDHGKMVSNYFINADPDTFKDIEIEEIDWDEVKADIGKEEKEEKEILEAEKSVDRLLKIYDMVKENKELKEKLKDIELKAGAVLNAKNKSNLKNAQTLIQSVLDSAGEEEGQKGEENKDTKKDDTVITDDKKEDPPKNEKKEEKTITVDEKVIAEAVTKALNYTLGITNK